MSRIDSISVVMVSYNSGEEILHCLESLAAAPSRRQLEIIVVDNASGDGSAALLAEQDRLRLIANQVNVGYARAVNQGIRAGRGDAYLVLNPDITVQPGSIDALADFLEAHPQVGLAGAKLLNEDGSLQHSCRSFYTFWTILLRRTPLGRLFPNSRALRRHLMLDFDHAASRRVDWVLGACMLVRREAVVDVGPMDERFFLYFEDVDWCYRLGKHGWEVWYEPAAVMTHVHKRASARSPFSRSLAAHIVSFIHYTEKWNPVSYLIKRYRDPLKAALLLLLDLVAVNAALATATALRLGLSRLFEHTYFDPDAYKRVAIFFNLIAIGSFMVMGLYRGSRRRQTGEELFAIIKAALLTGVALMAATFLTHERVVSRSVILLSLPLLILFSALLRAGLRRLHRIFLRYNFDLRRLLLVGTASEAEQLGRLVLAHPELGLDLVGRVTGHESEEAGSLGALSRLEQISEDERIQEILFAPSASAPRAVAPTLLWCRRRNLDLRVISDLAGIMSQGAAVEDFLGLPALSYPTQGFFRLQMLLKRLVDLLGSLVALALTLLPGLVHLWLMRLRGRPGLLRQPARGRSGRPIDFPLPLNAAGDRTRSDLLNPWVYLSVLRGQLSLVGPLPRRPDDDTSMLQDFQAMRPGVTGSWRRRDLSKRRESLGNLDRLYYYNWGLAYDFQLWLGTLGEQLRGYFPPFFLHEERGPS